MAAAVEVKQLSKQFERRERGPGLAGLIRSWLRPTTSTIDAVNDLSFSMDEVETLAFIHGSRP